MSAVDLRILLWSKNRQIRIYGDKAVFVEGGSKVLR